MDSKLISKYNIPCPRYTSYPTVPYWDTAQFSAEQWVETVQKSFQESNDSEGISLYIHLPFCESLCTFCGCHKRITKNHDVEVPYIEALIKEFTLYVRLFGRRPRIKELHLGGGTPTFFDSNLLSHLLQSIFSMSDKADHFEFSFEGHPNNTTELHLKTLATFGFNRVSFGVQDYNEAVQKAINRLQPFNNVKNVTDIARKVGYQSIGHDLIFGLPFQTKDDIIHTIEQTRLLQPDRIAFYSYAHVPWIKGVGQRGFKDSDLPTASQKRAQYEAGKALLEKSGYIEIGMDHFALKTDNLYKSLEQNTIHRNFMGYTASKTQLMVGLGVSSIGDSWYGFAQNEKKLETYYQLIEQDIIPVFRGHILDKEDLVIRRHILNIMCTLTTSWKTPETKFEALPQVIDRLSALVDDGLVTIDNDTLLVTPRGRTYVRNVCLCFDLRLMKNKPETRIFSMSV